MFGLFQINIIGLISNKVQLAKNFHIQPSEIDKMVMWEYELFMKELNDVIKKENKEQEKEKDKYGINDIKKMSNPSNLQRIAGTQGVKMPSIPNMSSISSLKI